MPALPRSLDTTSISSSISSSPPADARLLDSRQLRNALHHVTRAASHLAQNLHQKISKRQNTVVAIPAQYEGIDAGPAPGAVAGIVLGSIAGFLLIIWLLWILSSGTGFIRATNLVEEDVVVRRRSRSRGTRRSHRTEMTSRSPRRDRVIRQERIIRDSVPPPREASRIRETVLVEESMRPERRVDGDDIVEVIEEHSSVGGGIPPPRRKSRRSSGYR